MDRRSSNAMAGRFFAGRLGGHAQTLENLQILSFMEDLWCFESHNIQMFSKFVKLKYLGVTIKSAELGMKGNKKKRARNSLSLLRCYCEYLYLS